MSYGALIKDGVKGSPGAMVSISENMVNRAVFNAVVQHEYGRPLESEEEVEDVWEMMMEKYSGEIEETLSGMDAIDPEDEEALQQIQDELVEAFETEN